MEKCAHIAIPNKNKELFFGNARIEPALTQPDLGLYFSSDLKWNLHIDKVCGKANQIFQMIKRNVSLISSSAKLNLYKSMIVPILVYGSPCYGLSKYDISQLENTQKRIVKWNIPRKEPYKEKLEKLSILPLPMYIQINNLLLLSKILGGRYDSQNLQIPIVSSFSRFSLFQLDRPKNKTLENDFFYQTCRLSDFLRLDITDQTNLKKKLITLFLAEFQQLHWIWQVYLENDMWLHNEQL